MTDSISTQEYRFILLRHGESTANATGFHQGQTDFPLTERGKRQSTALATRWIEEKKRFDLIISSPLVRARETAEIIAAKLNIQIEFDPDLMERDAGLIS